MNYFPFHVGDYVASTAHLSWDEDMAYTRLIRVYYQTEKPIPKGQAYRLARATTPAQRAAVDSVLSEFFTTDEADGAFRQSRCDEEISKFNDKQSKAKRSANTRWERAKTHSEGNANASETHMRTHMRTHSDRNANQEPITNNQEPKTRSVQLEPPDAPTGAARAGPSMAAAVCMVLKAEGIASVNPGHPELQGLIDAGADAGMFAQAGRSAVEKGKGFAYVIGIVRGQMRDAADSAKAGLSAINSARDLPAETAYQRSMRERMEEVAPEIARRAPGAMKTAPIVEIFDAPTRRLEA